MYAFRDNPAEPSATPGPRSRRRARASAPAAAPAASSEQCAQAVLIPWLRAQAINVNRHAAALGGRVLTLGRSLVLAFGALTPGDYWLDITVRSRGGESASSRRVFTVR